VTQVVADGDMSSSRTIAHPTLVQDGIVKCSVCNQQVPMEGKIESFLDLSTPQAKKAFQKHLQECHQDEDFSKPLRESCEKQRKTRPAGTEVWELSPQTGQALI